MCTLSFKGVDKGGFILSSNIAVHCIGKFAYTHLTTPQSCKLVSAPALVCKHAVTNALSSTPLCNKLNFVSYTADFADGLFCACV